MVRKRRSGKRKTVSPRGKSKYYVTMTDKFMSGWGKARGKTNKLVLRAKNYQEALVIARNAKDRGEMIYINITSRKPYYPAATTKLSVASKKSYKNWYKKTRPFLDKSYPKRWP